MKILIAFPSQFLGGSERAMLETINAIKQDENIIVDALLPRNGPLTAELEKVCDQIHVIPYLWWMGPEKKSFFRKVKDILSSFKRIFSIYKVIRSRYNITVTSTITFPQLAIASFFAKIDHCWYIHEFGKEDHQFRYHLNSKLYYSIINRFSKVVIVNSGIVYNKFKQYIFPDKLKIIYCLVDVGHVRELAPVQKSDNDFRLTIIGRKAPGKRQEDGIKALKVLNEKGIFAKLFLVGSEEPAYKQYLLTLCEEYGLRAQVNFVSYVSDPYEYYINSDIILVTSKLEAFGRVVIEAMKLGAPVVMTNSGSGPEIINDGVTGLLFEAQDENDIAEKIELLYKNPELRGSLSDNAYNWAHATFNQNKHRQEIMLALSGSC